MELARQILTIALLVISALMIAVVLMQQSSESGLGAAFGSESSSLSAKGRAASKEAKLQKITKILAAAMGIFALIVLALS